MHLDKGLPKLVGRQAPSPLISSPGQKKNPCVSRKPGEGSPREDSTTIDNTSWSSTRLLQGHQRVVVALSGPSYMTRKDSDDAKAKEPEAPNPRGNPQIVPHALLSIKGRHGLL
jgi:hypothetical protein